MPRCALLLIGIDDFRAFNDMHGHAEGDVILQRVARRLRDASPRDAAIGRVGSDEFGVLLPSISDPTLVRHVGAAILSMLSSPHEHAGHRHHVLASIGACVIPAAGELGSDVLAAASLALARAKHDGGRTIRFFKPQMRSDVTARLSQLPIANGAVDAVVLPHTLEFETDPFAVVREADRVLAGEGHLIVLGFRPWSLWGFRSRAVSPDTITP